MDADYTIVEKLDRLKTVVGQYQSALVAYSGGVDSTLLLALSAQVLGTGVTAVTVRHLAHSEEDILAASRLAADIGVSHFVIDATTASQTIFNLNPVERCYLCKRLIYEMLLAEAQKLNIEVVLDGSHGDDMEDERPGLQALSELGIAMPLREAGLNKIDIRSISKCLGLPNYDQPARPCLATRFTTGERIDVKKLEMVKLGEDYLKSLGIRDFRVRYRDGEARIETVREEIGILLNTEVIDALNRAFTALGFTGVFLDLRGYQGKI